MNAESKANRSAVFAVALLGGLAGGLAVAGLVYWLVRRRNREITPVELPRPRRVPETSLPTAPAAPAKVLIVDDDRDFAELTGTILTQAGYQVGTASNTDEAFRAMQHDRPDLVLLDVMMTAPLEGLSISRKMQADRDLKNIPIVMISGIAGTEYASAFPKDVDIPIDAWISKPVDPEQVLETVQHVLRR